MLAGINSTLLRILGQWSHDKSASDSEGHTSCSLALLDKALHVLSEFEDKKPVFGAPESL